VDLAAKLKRIIQIKSHGATMFPSPKIPAIIDVEASGFGSRSYPIEIGFVLPDGRLECTLIRPEPDWTHWDAPAAEVHGITRELLMAFGKPADLVASWLNDQLRGTTIYSDSWGHDYGWLAVLFDAANLAPSFTLEHLVSIMPECNAARWSQVHREVELELGLKRHRASNDALILQRTWLRLMDSNQFVMA
jgi:hypothetical protein